MPTVILFVYESKYINDSDRSQPSRPAVDKDNRLRHFEEVNPGVEKIRRDDPTALPRPRGLALSDFAGLPD